MKHSSNKPPNWEQIEKHFPGAKWGKVAVAYKDTVYSKFPLTPDLKVHEAVHLERQKDPELWWSKYFLYPEFRLQEELLAYKAQYAYLCQQNSDRNYQAKILHLICSALSGPVYGNMVSYDRAKHLMK